jgi:hypothetical protein
VLLNYKDKEVKEMKKTASIALALIFAVILVSSVFASGMGHVNGYSAQFGHLIF